MILLHGALKVIGTKKFPKLITHKFVIEYLIYIASDYLLL